MYLFKRSAKHYKTVRFIVSLLSISLVLSGCSFSGVKDKIKKHYDNQTTENADKITRYIIDGYYSELTPAEEPEEEDDVRGQLQDSDGKIIEENAGKKKKDKDKKKDKKDKEENEIVYQTEFSDPSDETTQTTPGATESDATLSKDKGYDESKRYFTYFEVNNNEPFFTDKDIERGKKEVWETYSEFDELGRCQTAYANICKELMPTEERGAIGQVKPTGWHTIKYPGIVNGNYLYNRCHLIAYCLAAENANEKNLITGTRYFNVDGMLPFEEKVAKYMDKHPDNHVLYRVIPDFHGDELVARGVLMEALSIEDNEISFCVYVNNVQPGIFIDYLTGDSYEDSSVVVD